MSLIAKKKAVSSVPPIDAGTYIGVCVGVIDIGEQKNEMYNTYSQKVIFIFEIPSERIVVDDEDKPRWLSETYTVSLNEKANLAKVLISWRGKDFTEDEYESFDLASMIGKPCQLQVLVVQKKDGGTCNKIAGIFGLPKGFEAPKPENPLMVYSIEDGENETFLTLPEWIRGRIKKSTEWQTNHNGAEKLEFDDEPVKTETSASDNVPDNAIDPDNLPF